VVILRFARVKHFYVINASKTLNLSFYLKKIKEIKKFLVVFKQKNELIAAQESILASILGKT
jgi:hypothetical protein